MTRIRCRDYSKLTRNIKRIPTRLRHVCCSDPGGNRQRKQAGVLSGVKQQRAGHRVEPRGENYETIRLLIKLRNALSAPDPATPSRFTARWLGFLLLAQRRERLRHGHSLPRISSSSRKPCAMPIMLRPMDISATIDA